MIERIIEYSVRNRFVVILGVAGVSLWGVYCLFRTPIDAIPDLSENQVIVWADWEGRSPREIEDQVTYPLSVNLQGLAGVKSIRATSEFGFSMINVIFDEHIDFYFSRQRVLERLSIATSFLPTGVTPYLAPDATALGQIFWYTVEGEGIGLDELRAIQDWYVRYQLNSVSGVAEVASVGGFVREYQIDVDPGKLRAHGVSLGQVFGAVMRANSSAGGGVIQKGGAEYLVRGFGWIESLDDVRAIVVAERGGVPITVEQLGAVQLGPAFRRSVLEKGGREAVGGVVMMRYGQNPLDVTQRIQEKVQQLQAGLPPGVRIVPFYERTELIHAAIGTLTRALTEEIIVASLVVFLVLWHVRSAFVICVTLPLAILVSFIFMYYLGIPSNIMSLSGIAISIGILVDAGIVMTENAYNRLHERFGREKVTGDTRELVIDACKVVGGPLFFAIVIMLLSFAPVFVLGGIEGKMFNPLAYTKSFALVGVAILAITLVPALIPTFVRGRLWSQEEVWLVRSFVNIYKPLLEFFLRHPDVIVVITGIVILAGIPVFPRKVPWVFFVVGAPFIVGLTVMLVARRKVACFAILLVAALASFRFLKPLGEEFMPPLNELSIMDMPITTPDANITLAGDSLKRRDAVLREFPEVHLVVGKAGRAETPTDPAPVDMVETVVSFRPEAWWPKRKVRFEDVLEEARALTRLLRDRGILGAMDDNDAPDFAKTIAMGASAGHDRMARELCLRRIREQAPERGLALARLLGGEVGGLLRRKGMLGMEPEPAKWTAFEARLAEKYAAAFDEWILLEDVTRAANDVVSFLVEEKAVEARPDLLVEPRSRMARILEPLLAVAGQRQRTFFERVQARLEKENDRLVRTRVKRLNWELADLAPGAVVWGLIEGSLAKAREGKLLAGEPAKEDLQAIRAEREGAFASGVFLWRKTQEDLKNEMHSELQFPGWGNIWTRPIQNRVDMLSTGVRTMIGVKVFGTELDGLQHVSNEIAAVLKDMHGAVDVLPDQITGENYLEIRIDRARAARYGVNVQDVQDVIEIALGGKQVTMTVEGRRRFPVRVRYPRDWRQDEEMVKGILVPAGGADAAMAAGGMNGEPAKEPAMTAARGAARQIPLSLVADVKIVPGPSMIKSENGLLRSYVQLNVSGRDIVGFVEEAKRTVEARVKLPAGYYLEWSGQFEHQVRAQKTLTLVFPAVMLIIFVVLYLTYKDLPDTFMMFLAVPGALAGGALAQAISGHDFSVAVWVGYIACFGLATETGIVMLVYLREAIAKRGGMEKIQSEDEIKEAVIEGAVHRLRPKLLTEGTTVLALIPMLWATGVGSEFMAPMAVPILGGILVADEVIDIFIPVLFYRERCRRLAARRATEAAAVD